MWKTGPLIAVFILLIWGFTGPHFYMELDGKSYHPGEEAVLTIRNIGVLPIQFGQPYTLYRWENGAWVRVGLGFFFNARLYDLFPFGSWRQEITLKYLPENESSAVPRLHNLRPGSTGSLKKSAVFQGAA